jgi:hypothetical protein
MLDLLCFVHRQSFEEVSSLVQAIPERLSAPPAMTETNQKRSLHVQLQPSRSPDLDIEAVVNRLLTLASAVVTRGEDAGPYIDVNFCLADIEEIWDVLRKQILVDEEFAKCSIICCTGKNGWDDYLLLHHFDSSQPVDDLN